MRGGSLTRYHTPVLTQQKGKGLAEDLIKLAGPLIVQQAQAGLQDIQRGKRTHGPIEVHNSAAA